MSNEEIITNINDAMTTLVAAMSNAKKALSSANITVGQAETYNKGLQDAWELVVKLANMDYEDRQQILGVNNAQMKDILKFHTPQEILAKLEAYEKEQNEIKVGDVVICMSVADDWTDDCYGVVTSIYDDNHYEILMKNGDGVAFTKKTLKKIGKHIDIQSILQQIGGEANV